MGRAPCCSKVGLHRGPWSAREDTLLINYIRAHGEGHWRSLPKKSGLLRCGKSCRLRWMNYLRPDIKRGNITPDEDDLIIRLHSLLGNRWSLIAKRLPGRTDNEIKNYWNSHLSKRVDIKKSETKPKQGSSSRSSRIRKGIKCIPGKKEQKHDKDKPAVGRSTERKAAANPTKLHQPKASRVSPFSVIKRSSSLDSMISGSSSSSGSGLDANNKDSQVFDFPPYNWSDINAAASTCSGKALLCDEAQEFPYGFDAATFLDGAVAVEDSNMLDDIFEEYQQLLEADHHDPAGQTDSLFDSLLM